MDKAVGSKKILITGAAGFIGFHLAKLRLEQGDTVHGIDNLNNYYDVLLKKKQPTQLCYIKSQVFTLRKFNLYIYIKLTSLYVFGKLTIHQFKLYLAHPYGIYQSSFYV